MHAARRPVRSVELLPDAAGDAAVRRDWDALTAAGLPSLGRITAVAHRPHLTLAAGADLIRPDTVTGLPEPARTGGLLVFGTGPRVVLARAVVASAELLALHARLHERIGDAIEHTRPGRWTPHLTLARRIQIERIPEAIAVLGPGDEPFALEAARWWDAAEQRSEPIG